MDWECVWPYAMGSAGLAREFQETAITGGVPGNTWSFCGHQIHDLLSEVALQQQVLTGLGGQHSKMQPSWRRLEPFPSSRFPGPEGTLPVPSWGPTDRSWVWLPSFLCLAPTSMARDPVPVPVSDQVRASAPRRHQCLSLPSGEHPLPEEEGYVRALEVTRVRQMVVLWLWW